MKIAFFVAVGVGIALPLCAAAESVWTGTPWQRVIEEAPFSPRDTAEDLVFGGKMWLSNGYAHGNVLSRDLWCSADGRTWTLVNGATPYDGYSEMVAFHDKMWAIKGSAWCSEDGVTWTQMAEKTPFGARGYGETLIHNDAIWQLGSGADVWTSADGISWACEIEQAAYGARYGSAVETFGGKLWLMGGAISKENTPPEKHYPGFTTFNDVWSSTDGRAWDCVLEHGPWPPRMWFVAKVYADRLWIIGGFDNVHGANLGDVWYTADGRTWHEYRAATGFTARHEPTCYVHDGSLWVVAGNTWPVVNDAWRLTLK
ncbi:MAG TPA: hypothetical protein PLO37_08235 [Candidatus Hydrogenedentes bacterium]|nr:hypothetical protein [Candidatus Hydrogenedentota bacterium]HPG66819.1 hypothetical protein [Candidatus Hydrogenedentota bacterium]